jgi:hypothetical protein
MSPFKRKAEIILQGLTLTIDAEDEQRITQAGPWHIDMGPNVPVFYRAHGNPRNPYRELLQSFILELPFGSGYVEQIKPGLSYRKDNLRVYQPKQPKIAVAR